MNNNYITISDLNRYIKSIIDNNSHLQTVYLKGEISNFKAHSRGHWYFTLKDENSRINAIMFSSSTTKVKFNPIDGMKVLITGRISVYETSGSYQIYVNDMIEDGLGNLHIAFEKLKQKLDKEGLFDKSHKKRIPKIPKKIGIITAPTGAAIKDIISTLKRRFPICETILFPALVQGIDAAPSIVKQINIAQNYDIDVIILGRGGGSIEDLWAFNEEIVAHAIYESKIPIISAVGHEIDYTISDFVADLRAPTPTGAAEMAVPNIIDILNYIEQVKIRLNESSKKKIDYLTLLLNKYNNSYILKNPIAIYEMKEQNLDNLIDKLSKVIKQKLDFENTRLNQLKSNYILNNPTKIYEEKENNIKNIITNIYNSTNKIISKNNVLLAKYDIKHIYNLVNHYIELNNLKINNTIDNLNLLNPLNSLKRGYSIVKKENKVISDINKLKTNDIIKTELQNGYIESIVKKISMKEGI